MLKLRQYKKTDLFSPQHHRGELIAWTSSNFTRPRSFPPPLMKHRTLKNCQPITRCGWRLKRPSILSNRLTDEYDVSIGHVGSTGPSDVYVLAGDTVVAVGRRILPKAETAQDARECLAILSGRRHRVYGGIALHSLSGKLRHRLVQSYVRFRRFRHWILTNTLIMVIGGARLVVMPFRGWLHGLSVILAAVIQILLASVFMMLRRCLMPLAGIRRATIWIGLKKFNLYRGLKEDHDQCGEAVS